MQLIILSFCIILVPVCKATPRLVVVIRDFKRFNLEDFEDDCQRIYWDKVNDFTRTEDKMEFLNIVLFDLFRRSQALEDNYTIKVETAVHN